MISLKRVPKLGRVDKLKRLALCGTASLLLLVTDGLVTEGRGSEGRAAENDAASASGSGLQWGRPSIARRSMHSSITTRAEKRQRLRPHIDGRVVVDGRVVAAAWQEDDVIVTQTAAQGRSVVVQRSTPVYDPFDEDDSLAQLPDDPFDEPVGEAIPAPETDSEDDINAVEDALEQEIERRQSTKEGFDDEAEEMEDRRERDRLEEDPLEELGEIDLFGDEDKKGEKKSDDDAEKNGDRLQLGNEDLDFDLGIDREDEDYQPTAEELDKRQQEFAREQRESQESCQEELEDIEADRISSIDLSIRVDGNAGEDYPYECAVSTKRHQPRQWPQVTYNWKAAALCHKPLYFEQVQLERYGHSWGPYVQPIMSGVHFFGTIPVLPYKMGIRTPTECVYTLGYYRPGSCAPYMIDPIPFTWRAALFQAGAVTGVAATIP